MLRSKSQNSICEQEAKFVQERIAGVEKYFAELCTVFAAYTRKAARLRDKNDEVSKILKIYAESETVNRSLNCGLGNFATTLSVIGDYRDAEVQRLDTKVIAPLSQYSIICKHAREDVKNTFSIREKELTKRKNLEKIRSRNPRNRQMISQAEADLMKATVEVSRVVKGLEDQIDSFEKRKLYDIKTILLDFVMIELSFHTKAVELMTKAYQDIADIDEAKDLEDYQFVRGEYSRDFREVLNVPDTVQRLETVRRTSFRQACSLSNLTKNFSSPITLRKSANKNTESLDSMKAISNSSESVQVEEYDDDSSEETDDDTDKTSAFKSKYGLKNSYVLRPVPVIAPLQKLLTSSTIKTISFIS